MTTDPQEGALPEEDILVDVVLDEPKANDEHVKSGEEGIEELRQKLEAEQAERQRLADQHKAAEERARQQAAEAARYRTDAEKSRGDALVQAINSAMQEEARLQSELTDAMSGGDYARVAKLQSDLQRAVYAQEKAKEQRADYERQVAAQAQSQPQLSPASQAWVNAHPQFNTDTAFRTKTVAASNLALAEGCPVDSPEYFSRVEELIGLKQAAAPVPKVEAQDRNRIPVAAPPTRDAGATARRSPTQVSLDQDEREIAAAIAAVTGGTINDYAAAKLKLQRSQS